MNVLQSYNEKLLSDFVSEQWRKAVSYLHKYYGMSDQDCEDIFQESLLTLHENIRSGKLLELTSSMSTYFIAICRNKANELVRRHKREFVVNAELPEDGLARQVVAQADRILQALDDDESETQRRDDAVRQIVHDLPSPCNELLWGFYRDGFSMQELASMYGYKSDASVKVVKFRCMEKFRNRYKSLVG